MVTFFCPGRSVPRLSSEGPMFAQFLRRDFVAAVLVSICLPLAPHAVLIAQDQPAAQQPAPVAAGETANPSFELDPAWIKGLAWRSIGPANMGGRITDIAVYEA